VFRIDPSRTLKIAQALYERSYISYPRTSSQKLPATMGLKRIITELAKNPRYKQHADMLLSKNRTRPHEGMKEDEAHPAVYPTGVEPKKLSDEEEKIYDLVARRFLSCFAEYYRGEKRAANVSAGGEEYRAAGETVKDRGWLDVYTYYKPKELEVPLLEQGSRVSFEDAYMREGKTEPPKRFGKAGLIGLLEKKNLGTKATRAAIIDTLFDRGYIRNSRIEITDFGMSVYNALSKYCPEILDEEMTKKLDSDLEDITKGKRKKSEVVDEGKQMITSIIKGFTAKNRDIGEELRKGLLESEKLDILGRCGKCSGNLMVRKSRLGKQFVGCSNWPKCNNTYPLPQYAKIVPMGKVCEKCNTPKVKVFAKGKVYEMCLDPGCETKKSWGKKEVKEGAERAAPHENAVKAAGAGKKAGKMAKKSGPRAGTGRAKKARAAGPKQSPDPGKEAHTAQAE
jgi:DNA topoisomerase-1